MNNSNLWAVDVPAAQATGQQRAVPRQWSASSRVDYTPSFSPDGGQVAFQSTRSGWNEIWTADREGSHLRQLTELRGSVAGFPRWSPDGKKIVFHSRQQGYGRLFLLDPLGGRAMPLSYEAINDFAPSWSHDEKWIYFTSRRSGENEVWKVAADGGLAVRVTRHDGWNPLESPDGQYLYYAKGDSSVWRMALSSGEERLMFSQAGDDAAYAPGRKGVYFIREASPGRKRNLVFLRLADSRMIILAEISRPLDFGFAVSPDERMILYSQIDHVTSELMLVEHFR
jgi:Tol biopolymer transport system component